MPRKPTLYLETTIPSYLASFPSRDLIVAAHQQITAEWWVRRRTKFRLFISEVVVGEIRLGDPDAALRRMAFLRNLPVLRITKEIETIASRYQSRLGLPKTAQLDLLHLACAVGYDMEYLLTWNCTHLANGMVIRRLQEANAIIGLATPIIVTPEGLFDHPKGI